MKCKKSRLLALCISLVLVLAGCTASGQSITPTYPRIEYRNSTYNFDPYNREIPIPEGYVLNEGYSFDIIETDAGCDVVLHFVESEDKTNTQDTGYHCDKCRKKYWLQEVEDG